MLKNVQHYNHHGNRGTQATLRIGFCNNKMGYSSAQNELLTKVAELHNPTVE